MKALRIHFKGGGFFDYLGPVSLAGFTKAMEGPAQCLTLKNQAGETEIFLEKNDVSHVIAFDTDCVDQSALEHMDAMCLQSLSPEQFELWQGVKESLIKTRNSLQK